MALLLLKLEATTWKCIGTFAVSLLARLAYTRDGFAVSTSRGAQDIATATCNTIRANETQLAAAQLPAANHMCFCRCEQSIHNCTMRPVADFRRLQLQRWCMPCKIVGSGTMSLDIMLSEQRTWVCKCMMSCKGRIFHLRKA